MKTIYSLFRAQTLHFSPEKKDRISSNLIKSKYWLPLFVMFLLLAFSSIGQTIEKIRFTPTITDTTSNYYLAVRPKSGKIKGVLVLFSSFEAAEKIFPETKLHNVAYANDILTIAASMDQALYASPAVISNINDILNDVVTKFSADPKTFVLGGFDMSGMIILRYIEMAIETPGDFALQPKAIFTIDSPTDLIGFWHYCEREIRKNFLDVSVRDARYFIDQMTKENGTIYNNMEKYVKLSPFTGENHQQGNEVFLKKTPVRFYYDTDINWQLKNRRRGYYDTHMPGGSELVSRLMLEGNEEAEFISSKIPGVRRSGLRHPTSWSIVDEAECIQWMREKLGLFYLDSWEAPYKFIAPDGWRHERISMPMDFAPQIPYTGVEDIRFAPGWDEKDNENYWSYTFLWCVDGQQLMNEQMLDNDLTAYYRGLVNKNLEPGKMPDDKAVPVKVSVKKIKTLTGDIATFSAVISMIDYMGSEPIMLNSIIHSRKCGTQSRSIILFEVSPQSPSGPIWKQLSTIGASVFCN